MCHKQKWCMLFFACVKSVAHVLASACATADKIGNMGWQI